MKNIDIEEKKPHFFRTLFFILILFIILIIIYGKFLGNSGLILKEYEINDNFPDSFNNFKIAHFSDVLIKTKDDYEKIDLVVNKLNDKKTDIILFSGNLTDGKYSFDEQETNKIVSKLSKLECTYGKYYVNGINDKKNPSYEGIMQRSGFVSLNDNKDIIISKKNEKIIIVGLDNNTSTGFIPDIIKDSNDLYKIVVFSESDEIDEIKDYNFNLALSSNSLNGQINVPIVKDFFLREGSKKYIEPYYKINNTKFYISSGIGTDMIDYRLFNKPSANIYILKKKNM